MINKNYTWLMFCLKCWFLKNYVSTMIPTSNKTTSMCIIKNLDYNNEFLYAFHESTENPINNNQERKIFTNPISVKHMKTFDQAEWLIISMNSKPNTFYIKSSLYKQYLCASDINLNFLNHRRKVSLIKIVDNLNNTNHASFIYSACLWKLEQLNKRSNKFIIWNYKFREPLYAVSNIYKTLNSRRNVFTWVNKAPNSKQFIWSIGCHDVSKL